MMGKIEEQLRAWRDVIDMIDGRRLVNPYEEFPEFNLYNKAWRLKCLGKCPSCGADVKMWRCSPERRTDVECPACDFKFTLHDDVMIRADDADDPIIEIVRQALEKQEAPA